MQLLTAVKEGTAICKVKNYGMSRARASKECELTHCYIFDYLAFSECPGILLRLSKIQSLPLGINL